MTAAGSAILGIDAVSVSYGSTKALRQVSLTVDQGEIVAILGANGAGKSTLARSICGLVPVGSGTITFEGHDVSRVRAARRPRLGIICVPEGRGIFSDLTVLENLRLGYRVGARRKSPVPRVSIDSILDEYPKLRARLRQVSGTLSGGEQQMLVLARATLARPSLLILDEPSLGLAPIIVSQVYERIQTYPARGITVLLIEQAVHKSLQVASRAYVLSNGRVVAEGSSANLMNTDLVREAYLGGNVDTAEFNRHERIEKGSTE